MTTITNPWVIPGSDGDRRDTFQHIALGSKFKGRPVSSGASERSGSSPQLRSDAVVVRDHQMLMA